MFRYIRCTYGIFSREITMHTVIYSEYVQFWPTLIKMQGSELCGPFLCQKIQAPEDIKCCSVTEELSLLRIVITRNVTSAVFLLQHEAGSYRVLCSLLQKYSRSWRRVQPNVS